jgi:hypothetical protein
LTLKVGELYLQFEHPLHSIVPALFECAGNEAVAGIGLLIAAFCQIGLITGTLDPVAPLRGNCFITFFQVVQRFEGELDCHRCYGDQLGGTPYMRQEIGNSSR